MEIKIHSSTVRLVARMAVGMTPRLEESQMDQWVQIRGNLAGPKGLLGQLNACEVLVGSEVYAGLHIVRLLAIL